MESTRKNSHQSAQGHRVPENWPFLSNLDRLTACVSRPLDEEDAPGFEGLSYTLRPDDFADENEDEKRGGWCLSVRAWRYDFDAGERDREVLRLRFVDRPDLDCGLAAFMPEITVLGHPVYSTEHNAMSAFGAGIFFIREILADRSPDPEGVMREYGLHPSQQPPADEASRRTRYAWHLARREISDISVHHDARGGL